MVKRRTLLRLLGAIIVANGVAAAIVWACGPDFSPLPTVTALDPGDPAAFDRGEIGVVRPRFRRATLARAYRVLNAQPPLKVSSPKAASANDPGLAWDEIRKKFSDPVSDGAGPERKRRMIDYVTPFNCLEDAYLTAVRTFADRQSRYGAGNPQLREWVRAQVAVFANCDEEPLLLPEPAAASADALTKADRAYQTAAAYFYAMHYEEAARRFQAIGDDASSPWRPYGHYLAARATLRTATMADEASPIRRDGLTKAEVELEAVIADPVAAPVRGSARGLLKFVRVRLRPFDQLRELSARIASTPDELPQSDLADFTYLLDRQIGDSVDFDYGDLTRIDRLRESSDLVDWIVAMQGTGPAARDRAIARWRETRLLPWLVAALSQVNGPHESTDSLLLAAAAVPPASPSYATVAFLRVRLLIALGRLEAARQVLSTLPDAEGAGVSAETINLYRGERLMVATTLEEFLKAAPRSSLGANTGYASTLKPLISFDEDAGVVLAERFPLERLVDAGLSTALPARLRTRVAVAAFTRAILLDRHDQARRIAPALKLLAKPLAADVDRYMRETTAGARRRAAVLLILRTPGMTRDVRGLDDFYSAQFVEPRRSIESFVSTWWCGPAPSPVTRQRGDQRGAAASELIHALYPTHVVPYPSFISLAEQRAVEAELTSLDAIGHATKFLATAALDWARERPADAEAAEALSRIVRGWRYACREAGDAELSQRSFAVLHGQFRNSEWAKRTPFWYR